MRTCAEPGCNTRLSQYNSHSRCNQHMRLHVVPSVLLRQQLPDWGGDAPCAMRDTDRWFTDDVASNKDLPGTAYSAIKVCYTCPYRRECLQWAFDQEQLDRSSLADVDREESDRRYGIFGGIPGRIRERYADTPDRIAQCVAWLEAKAATKGWAPSREETG